MRPPVRLPFSLPCLQNSECAPVSATTQLSPSPAPPSARPHSGLRVHRLRPRARHRRLRLQQRRRPLWCLLHVSVSVATLGERAPNQRERGRLTAIVCSSRRGSGTRRTTNEGKEAQDSADICKCSLRAVEAVSFPDGRRRDASLLQFRGTGGGRKEGWSGAPRRRAA